MNRLQLALTFKYKFQACAVFVTWRHALIFSQMEPWCLFLDQLQQRYLLHINDGQVLDKLRPSL